MTRLPAAHWDLLCKQDTIVSMALHPPAPHPPAPGSTPSELITAWRMKPTPAGIPGLHSLAQLPTPFSPQSRSCIFSFGEACLLLAPPPTHVGSSHDQGHGACVGRPNPGLPTALSPRALTPPSWFPRLFIRGWVWGSREGKDVRVL